LTEQSKSITGPEDLGMKYLGPNAERADVFGSSVRLRGRSGK